MLKREKRGGTSVVDNHDFLKRKGIMNTGQEYLPTPPLIKVNNPSPYRVNRGIQQMISLCLGPSGTLQGLYKYLAP